MRQGYRTSDRAPPGRRRRPQTTIHVLSIFALAFCSVVLLVLDRLDNSVLSSARDQLEELAAPAFGLASRPAKWAGRAVARVQSYVGLAGELERLELENKQLKRWEWTARRLERKLTRLRALLKAVEDPALGYVTARVIADSRGPFVRSILVNAGRTQGVRAGLAVIDASGLVGRTVEAGASTARVLLVTDLNSRVPVLVGPGGVRAVLSGTNRGSPTLSFLPVNARVRAGDLVVTSGHGGLLPRGLPIGVVVETNDGPVVRPHARLGQLDYVSVLFFESPELAARRAEDKARDEKRIGGRRAALAGRNGARP